MVLTEEVKITDECELFGDFGVFIQIILGVGSIASLLGNLPLRLYCSEEIL